MGKSRSWPNGSSRAYRKARERLLAGPEGQTCKLCGKPIDRRLRGPHPMSGSVHHIGDRALTGDDPRHMVAAHLLCNQQAGDPRTTDPAPTGRTRW